MARLLIKTGGLDNQTIDLRLGVNRVGRDSECDFQIEHSTVSSLHCELAVSNDGVYLRDCDSTNGTFINGDPIKEAWLMPGQQLKLGDVELFVESTEVTIAIPKVEREPIKPEPVVTPAGEMMCPRHVQVQATYKCTHCSEIMCNSCVHVMRRKGGNALFLCPICSHKCERIELAQGKKKKTFLGFLQDTVKLRFKSPAGRDRQ